MSVTCFMQACTHRVIDQPGGDIRLTVGVGRVQAQRCIPLHGHVPFPRGADGRSLHRVWHWVCSNSSSLSYSQSLFAEQRVMLGRVSGALLRSGIRLCAPAPRVPRPGPGAARSSGLAQLRPIRVSRDRFLSYRTFELSSNRAMGLTYL